MISSAAGWRTLVALAFLVAAPAQADGIEHDNSAAIGRINADTAYSRGIAGRGVTIAILDSGIDSSHHEFVGAGKLAPGFNAITGGGDVSDRFGHGTHVAGIIGAERDGRGMFGVAWEATLLPIKVLSDSGNGSVPALDRGLRYATGRAAIANISLGAGSTYNPAALREAVRGGLLIVAAAGNDGAGNPGWPARFAKESWANNQIIAVGAVDGANRIASFSNRAGDSAAWFLVAPGTGILSSYPVDRYAVMSGTSMAAPVVSGAAALLKQLWPALRADQIATILFVTATDLGAPGIDPVYGRGLLNVQKALQPIGRLITTTVNGRAINVLAGSTQVSAATSKLWALAAAGRLHALGLDDYQRDFSVDLGATVMRPPGMSLEQVFGNMDSRIEAAEHALPGGARLMLAYERPAAAVAGLPFAERAPQHLHGFGLLSPLAGGSEAALGAGGFAARYFGLGGLRIAGDTGLDAVPALANPYFSLVPQAAHLGFGRRFGATQLKFGALTSAFNTMLGSQDLLAAPPAMRAPRAHSTVFELSQSFGDAALSLALMRIDETNGYLGSYSSGPLTLSSDASTKALQLAGVVRLAPKLALAAQAAYGVTPGSLSGNSLITEVSANRSNAFALALVAADSMCPGDRLSLSLSQPMRTYAGQIAMDLYTGLNSDGSPARERMQFSMVPLGRELRGEINYATPAGPDASLGATLMLRHEPDHLPDTAMEKLLALRYLKQF